MNMRVTTVDLGSVQLGNNQFQDELLTFAGENTFVEGTILARDSVSGKLVPFVPGGNTNENGIPKAVLAVETTRATAGDVPIRPIISGDVVAERLVIDNGDPMTAAIKDQLRSYGIVALSVADLSVLDNGGSA